MKHLKGYKIFESFDSNNEFIQQVIEILLDLSDDGFNVIPDTHGRDGDDFTDISRISVEINDDERNQYFNYSKIEDPIGHLILFMKDKGYVLSRVVYGDDYDKYDNIIEDILTSGDSLRLGKDEITDKGVSLKVLKNLEIANFIVFHFITKQAMEDRLKDARKKIDLIRKKK
jgi:hypothetical protein